jgi:hypothetical protein
VMGGSTTFTMISTTQKFQAQNPKLKFWYSLD